MSGLVGYLENLKAKRMEVENQDIEAFVAEKLKELEPQIRAQAEQSQAYEKKVLDIKIEAITDAIAVVEAEKVVETEATAEEVATDIDENGTIE